MQPYKIKIHSTQYEYDIDVFVRRKKTFIHIIVQKNSEFVEAFPMPNIKKKEDLRTCTIVFEY